MKKKKIPVVHKKFSQPIMLIVLTGPVGGGKGTKEQANVLVEGVVYCGTTSQ